MTIQFVSQFYDKNSRSRDFKYEIVNVGTSLIKKIYIFTIKMN